MTHSPPDYGHNHFEPRIGEGTWRQEVVQNSQISARRTGSVDSSHALIAAEEFVHCCNLKRPMSIFFPEVFSYQLTFFVVFFFVPSLLFPPISKEPFGFSSDYLIDSGTVTCYLLLPFCRS